jgi:hypothetical protein
MKTTYAVKRREPNGHATLGLSPGFATAHATTHDRVQSAST